MMSKFDVIICILNNMQLLKKVQKLSKTDNYSKICFITSNINELSSFHQNFSFFSLTSFNLLLNQYLRS